MDSTAGSARLFREIFVVLLVLVLVAAAAVAAVTKGVKGGEIIGRESGSGMRGCARCR